MTEGNTDLRFLESIVKRTFEEIAFDECTGELEISVHLYTEKSDSGFIDYVKKASKSCMEYYYIMVLCVHLDADSTTDDKVFANKIKPAQDALSELDESEYCRILTAIVPVQMTEAWMMADKELLKKEIGTSKSDEHLGIDKKPEAYSDPKKTIEDAIRTAREDLTKKRRRELKIDELYSLIGQKTSIEKLNQLPSYSKFKDAVRDAYKRLGYLH